MMQSTIQTHPETHPERRREKKKGNGERKDGRTQVKIR